MGQVEIERERERERGLLEIVAFSDGRDRLSCRIQSFTEADQSRDIMSTSVVRLFLAHCEIRVSLEPEDNSR